MNHETNAFLKSRLLNRRVVLAIMSPSAKNLTAKPFMSGDNEPKPKMSPVKNTTGKKFAKNVMTMTMKKSGFASLK